MEERRPEISDEDYERLSQLRTVLRRFNHFSTAAAAREGLPSQQHQALLLIKGARERDGVTAGHLADRLLIAPHSAAELVNRLTAAGYVDRTADPNDRRRHLLTLTPKAEAVLVRLSEVHLREIRDMAPALITLLETLRDAGEG